MEVASDIQYRNDTDYDPILNNLDIYYTDINKPGLKRQVVVFIHGGGWSNGDKALSLNNTNNSTSLPRWFVRQGYVFVSINFRLAESYKKSDVTISDMALDVAKALKWLTVNIRHYGGQVKNFILLGYSSGAHLATLIATRQSYLKKYRMNTSILRGVISMDIAHFDIPLLIDKMEPGNAKVGYRKRLTKLMLLVGKLPSQQKLLSPSYHIGSWLYDTRFLLLSAGFSHRQKQSLTFEMNQEFKDLLVSHDVDVTHHHFANKDHLDFVNKFDDEIREALIKFLARV